MTDESRLRQLSAFFFWTAWAASTDRPGENISYTNNWPYEPLVGNRPSGQTVVWTGVSIIMLLAGISAMAWWYAARRGEGKSRFRPKLIRWEAGMLRPRKKPPSNTSGWYRRCCWCKCCLGL